LNLIKKKTKTFHLLREIVRATNHYGDQRCGRILLFQSRLFYSRTIFSW